MRNSASHTENPAGSGTVSARLVDHLIGVGVSAGLGKEVLIEAAGLAEVDLTDPDKYVPLAVEIALWQTIATHVCDPQFGVRAGQSFHLRDVGLIGYVARFSATLHAALLRLQRYGRVFTEAVQFVLQEGRPEVALANAHPALGPGHSLAETYRLAAVIQASRELTGVAIVPERVTFTYPLPAIAAAHARHFRCPLEFGADRASIVFRRPDLELPLENADETLAGYLGRYAEQVLASLVQGQGFRQQVKAVVWSLLGEGTPSLERVSSVLGLSQRTLQRRLAMEGTSLRREIEEIRKGMAVAVLRDRTVAINDVAFLVGYSEPGAFFRAFKLWTGMTPTRFRDSLA